MSVNNRPKPWSYSALSSFELCPRKFWTEKVGRTVKKRRPTRQEKRKQRKKHRR